MAVLITGGFGFVGLNVAEELLRREEEVVLFGLGELPEAARADFAALPGVFHCFEGDVCDASALERAFGGYGVDHVFHGAAVTAGPDRERHDPAAVMEVNLMGTIATLEAARRHGVRRFLSPSSCSVYGASDYDVAVCDEATTQPVPESVYAISKYAAERTAIRLGKRWEMDVVAARITEVFGPWERDTGVRDTLSAPLLVTRLAMQGQEAVLPRPGQRDWGYARDVARALLALLDAEKPKFDVYNISTGVQWTIEAWCDRLRQVYPDFRYRMARSGEEANVDYHDSRDRSPLAIERLTTDIGYQPSFPFTTAFDDYMEWIKDHPESVVQ